MDEAANDNAGPGPVSRRRCPICGKPSFADISPFCSKRCADVDLHRWLGEGYRVPVAVDGDASEAPDGE